MVTETKHVTSSIYVARSSMLLFLLIKMQSVIFTFINCEGDECVSIGSMQYFKSTRKTCKQLVNAIAWNHSEDDREVMMSGTQDELYTALMNTLKNNQLHVFYPN